MRLVIRPWPDEYDPASHCEQLKLSAGAARVGIIRSDHSTETLGYSHAPSHKDIVLNPYMGVEMACVDKEMSHRCVDMKMAHPSIDMECT